MIEPTLLVIKGDFDHILRPVFLVHSNLKTNWAIMAPYNMPIQRPLHHVTPSTNPT